MGVATSMYVRRTLPLEQACNAMRAKAAKAAVVVDDNFQVRRAGHSSRSTPS